MGILENLENRLFRDDADEIKIYRGYEFVEARVTSVEMSIKCGSNLGSFFFFGSVLEIVCSSAKHYDIKGSVGMFWENFFVVGF